MRRKPVHEWMLLMTYVFGLVFVLIHSGYLCKKIVFVCRQFVPLLFAGIVAMVLYHPYQYVYGIYQKKMKIPEKVARISSLCTIYLAIIGVCVAALHFALPRFTEGVQQFVENREMYMKSFEITIEGIFQKIRLQYLDISPFIERISESLGELDVMMTRLFPKMAQFTTGAFRTLATAGIVMVLSFYMLYDAASIKKQVKRMYEVFIPEKFYTPVLELFRTAAEVFNNFIIGQGIESVILGTLCGIGMVLLQLEYSLFVSLVVGITAFIPFFGAYIGGGMGTLLLLFISVKKAMTFFVFFVILQQVENNLIYPRVVGKRTGLPGLWVLASVTIGGGLFGIGGMILSVPMATFLYILLFQGIARREIKKNARQKDTNDL